MKDVAVTQKSDIKSAIDELFNSLKPTKSDLVLYFASSGYDAEMLAREFHKKFQVDNIGCTTSGEIVSGDSLDNSIVAMRITPRMMNSYKISLIEEVNTDLEKKIDKSLNQLASHYKQRAEALDFKKYVGLLLMDGLSNKEEKINDLIGNKTSVQFVGGSAGDNLKFKTTYLFYNGNAYAGAALLVLLEPKNGYEIIKTQSFKPTGIKLKVTKAKEEERRVIEFNNKPAADAYADALGCAVSELGKNLFMNPIGLVLDESDPFVRSPRILENKDVLFYCGIKQGQELELLKSTDDIVAKTSQDLKKSFSHNGGPAGVLVFNCVLRKLELEQKKQIKDFGKLFEKVPTIGFHTYGESYIGHVNQTATMLVLN